jgi:hypothetical protein
MPPRDAEVEITRLVSEWTESRRLSPPELFELFYRLAGIEILCETLSRQEDAYAHPSAYFREDSCSFLDWRLDTSLGREVLHLGIQMLGRVMTDRRQLELPANDN